jgi:hypothetical protein
MALGGCINVLYRLEIVQSTGFIYDYYLFPDQPTPLTTALQQQFIGKITAAPPRILILSRVAWPTGRLDNDKLSRWADFKAYLDSHYHLVHEYAPLSKRIVGYRIYLLR